MKKKEVVFDLRGNQHATIPPYNPLLDTSLRTYYESRMVRKHLYEAAFIDRQGRVLDPERHKSKIVTIEQVPPLSARLRVTLCSSVPACLSAWLPACGPLCQPACLPQGYRKQHCFFCPLSWVLGFASQKHCTHGTGQKQYPPPPLSTPPPPKGGGTVTWPMNNEKSIGNHRR